MTESYLWSINY